METHCSILAWRIPWIHEPSGLQAIESQRVRYNETDLACTHARRGRKTSELTFCVHRERIM